MKINLESVIKALRDNNGLSETVAEELCHYFGGSTEISDTEFLAAYNKIQSDLQEPQPSPSHMLITSRNQIDDFDDGVLA